MDQPDREVEPQFSQPVRQITLMLIVLALVSFGANFLFPQVAPVFLANPYLNGFIVFVFVIGVIACFWQVWQLVVSVGWIEGYVGEGQAGKSLARAPRLLAPLASLFRARGARMQIGAASSRSILDSVATRIDEARDITRYIVNLLIFLGLLGTFFGLATTVPAVVETIRSLAPQAGEEGIHVFERLMTGLEAQLGGMGTAFASSLLGLAGSLVVGLLELFASHGQNRFYRELEEWLSTITRLGFSSGDHDGEGMDGAAASGVLEHVAVQMEALQSLFTQSDVSRALVDERLGTLADAVARLAAQIEAGRATNTTLERLAEGQEKLLAHLERQASGDGGGGAHTDAESRMRLRSIDVQLLRILEELSAGRQEALADLRTDLAGLTKAVRRSAGPGKEG